MNILVVNAGSSSLKYQLFDMSKGLVLAKGLFERIGLDGHVKHVTETHPVFEANLDLPDHASAIRKLIELLVSKEYGVLEDMSCISAVGHRVVHGGERFASSVRVTDEVLAAIEQVVSLAPLHNPPNLVGIRACQDVMGDVPQVAVFDTAFHQTMPRHSFMYALPYDYYTEHKIRRYGFHGTSHRYVSERAANMLKKPLDELKLITCHLGNGSSLAAIDGGRSVDTSMGMTPLEGVPMGTRSGCIDPAIPNYLCAVLGLPISEVTELLNKKSGMLGLSGVSSDFRDLHEAAKNGSDRAQLALDIFAYSVRKLIGAYVAAMDGVDALVFTAGVGENSHKVRQRVCEGLNYFGLTIDLAKNKNVNGEADISSDNARARVLVIPTNEELVIARDTQSLL